MLEDEFLGCSFKYKIEPNLWKIKIALLKRNLSVVFNKTHLEEKLLLLAYLSTYLSINSNIDQ